MVRAAAALCAYGRTTRRSHWPTSTLHQGIKKSIGRLGPEIRDRLESKVVIPCARLRGGRPASAVRGVD